ncbi:MAG: hypothetical protein NXY57DRAFT_904870 [Lentinula lateritia]|nr:MAG: hypothetical protein NXY57DRAFT_904870 [Lentinula lateritia]
MLGNDSSLYSSTDNLNSIVAFPSSNHQDRTSVYSVQSSISTNSNDSLPQPPTLPYLPFRRISLPSLPPSQSIQHSPLRRQTTQPLQPQRSSIASFDSFPAIEERERRESNSTARNHLTAVSMQTDLRPPSISPMRRKSRGLSVLPLDDPLLVKRRKVMIEFYETEKAYVEGLDLIYEHFLLPILNSLDRPTPILERPLLTAVFSNFVDIWNLHHSFYSELTRLFYASEQKLFPSSPPPLSPVLLTHFPYLSLYTPFITAFPQILSALNTLLTPTHYYRQRAQAQTHFVATQEKHPRCGKLQLRDWLLTIVQRCPRYLLLLRDLLTSKEEERERERLIQVFGLVSKITNSLNTSIWSHSQTLALLALQRSTPNLPLDEFQFISPGRTLLKRGTLLQVENPDARVRRGESKDGDMRPREREFLLFSDCLVWLANEEAEKKEKEWNFELDLGSIWSSFMGSGTSSPEKSVGVQRPRSAALVKSTPLIVEEEFDIDTIDKPDDYNSLDHKTHVIPASAIPRNLRRPPMVRTRSKNQWLYKGRIELVNLEIVVDTSFTVEDELEELGSDTLNEIKWRWEVLSPEGSFVLYAASVQERTEWTTLIRKAKSQQLVALNAQHPNSTLTSSEATQHIRRALQALPFAPNDVRMQGFKERRLKVEHWVPAIWIPDEKAEGCMRCGRIFGWRRRRHHCRLCGRCTFYITDPNINDDDAFSKSARACNACYESVFPLIDHHHDPKNKADDSTVRTRSHPPLAHSSVSGSTSSFLPPSTSTMTYALMAIDSKRYGYGLERRRQSDNSGKNRTSRDSGVVFDLDSSTDDIALDDVVQPMRRGSRIKLRSQSSSGSRPRSYIEVFHSAGVSDTRQPQTLMQATSPLEEMAEFDEDTIARLAYVDGEDSSVLSSSSVNSSRRHTTINLSTSSSLVSLSISPPISSGELNVNGRSPLSNASLAERREDTVRRNKRFSMPAVALQTTSVVARTQSMSPETSEMFSLVLGGRLGHSTGIHTGGRNEHASPSSRRKGGGDGNKTQKGSDLGKGVAASRLNELLGRSK